MNKTMTSKQPLLEIKDLSVAFRSDDKTITAVDHLSLSLNKGETLALVGESGSGKSVTALSVLKLLPKSASHASGEIYFEGDEILGKTEQEMGKFRGNRIGMIFQEPTTSLNPLHTIKQQIMETLDLHTTLSKRAACTRVKELLGLVGIRDIDRILQSFPHALSGGQKQRVMIAIAIANDPDLLIADEPTTALDVTIQAQILELLLSLKTKLNMALLLITHDLGIVKKMADRVCVMTRGKIVERNTAKELFEAPQHPYTQKLLNSEPKGNPIPIDPAYHELLLKTEHVRVWFPIKTGVFKRTTGHVKAVNDASITVRRGETLGIVGESGSGKTTLALALLRLQKSKGLINFEGEDIHRLGWKQLRPLRRKMQIVFQDPYGSLSPRLTVEQIIGEGLDVHQLYTSKAERSQLIMQALTEVGLEPGMLNRHPHEFSGGQRQRISIARAIVLKPDLLILDEPTSALDMTVQAQIVDLLRDLQKRHHMAYVFISHDLKVVRALSHQIIVMKEGDIVEHGPREQIFENPQTPYTQSLIAAAFDLTANT